MAIDKKRIVEMVPQQAPFRFIDDILEVDDGGIVGQYTFKEDEFFYQGHFPGNPITPGVILLETMAQTAVVAYGLYLCSSTMAEEELMQFTTLFSDAEVEFLKPVLPKETVTIKAKKQFFRRMKLKVTCEMTNAQGEVVAQATLSGVGVKT